MKRLLGTALLLAILAATGCSSDDGGRDEDPPSGTNADSGDDLAEDEPTEEESSDSEAPEENPTFGEAYTWENGLTVKVGIPKPYKPSDSASAGKGEHIAFDITVVNKTGANYDVSCDSLSMQSGNAEAEQIFDSENGLEGSPSTALLDGRESKFRVGFTVSDPTDLVLQYSSCDFDAEPAFFVSSR